MAAFEPANHVLFFGGEASGSAHTPPPEKGDHGFWPLRHDYRSVFLLAGPDMKAGNLGPVEMTSLEETLAMQLGIKCPKPQ